MIPIFWRCPSCKATGSIEAGPEEKESSALLRCSSDHDNKTAGRCKYPGLDITRIGAEVPDEDEDPSI